MKKILLTLFITAICFIANGQKTTLCFQNKEKCDAAYGTYVICNLRLTTTGDKVEGGQDCSGCGGNGSTRYEGYAKGDTLFLKAFFDGEMGEESLPETIWLLKPDKLYQFETIENKGLLRRVLTDKTHFYLIAAL
jgi:hypothetical protein